jgi:hypothetical protein
MLDERLAWDQEPEFEASTNSPLLDESVFDEAIDCRADHAPAPLHFGCKSLGRPACTSWT